jgi:hypothetical protein
MLLLLAGCKPHAKVFVAPATGCEQAQVQSAIDQAQDGDVVQLPACTASWNSQLTISKGITLQGQTTTAKTGTWPDEATANDKTIILDEFVRPTNAPIILVDGANARITGITFRRGATTGYAHGDGAINFKGGTLENPNYSQRIDHCHFDGLLSKDVRNSGVSYGLADHNLHDDSFYQEMSYYMITSQDSNDAGNGVWADYPYLGTNKFFFIEDNTIRGNGGGIGGTIDSSFGGRFVVRHNAFTKGAHMGGHGTEGGNVRGIRCSERYNNTIEVQGGGGQGKMRGGLLIEHDETFVGDKEPNSLARLQVFRLFAGGKGGNWGTADGRSPWDQNDTEGNNTYVEGHAPHLFYSGTATQATAEGTLIDEAARFADNLYGYGVRHMRMGKGSSITANTATNVTYERYGSTDRGPLIIFNPGDAYEIHRCISALDQCGRGKGDLIKISKGLPVNQRTQSAAWPAQQREPCVSWNSAFTGTGSFKHFNSTEPAVQQNRDYYNFGADTQGAETFMHDTYTAVVNGEQYEGTYTYPHPLQSGGGGGGTISVEATLALGGGSSAYSR